MVEREQLVLPQGANKLLLHSCCAPCSGKVMETLLASRIDFSIFFYNPNIHPLQEYCGCVYSLRDTNNWRKQNERDRIKIGVNFYGDTPVTDK